MNNEPIKNYKNVLASYATLAITITASIITILQVIASLSIGNNNITSTLINFFKTMSIETKIAIFIFLECFLAWFFSAVLSIFCKDYLKDKIKPQHIMVIFIWLALSTWISIYNIKIIIISKLGVLYGQEFYLSLIMIIIAYLFAIWMIENHFKENTNNLNRFQAIQTVCFAIYFFIIIFFDSFYIDSNKKNINETGENKVSTLYIDSSIINNIQKALENKEIYLEEVSRALLNVLQPNGIRKYDRNLSNDLQKQKEITEETIQQLKKEIINLKFKIYRESKNKSTSFSSSKVITHEKNITNNKAIP